MGDTGPHTRMWRNGRLEAAGFPPSELPERLREPGTVLWLDLCDPREEELEPVADALGLDPVAIEDAVSSHERTKLDHYRDYAFLNAYAPEVTGDEMVMHEVSAFVSDRMLVTVRQGTGFDVDALVRRWDGGPEPPGAPRTVLLLYGLLDMLIDLQLDAAQALDDEADALEDLIFDAEAAPGREIQRRGFRLRKDLAALRRVALPMREIVNALLRHPDRTVPEALVPYFQDVYDHALRVGESTDGLRDLVANLMDTRVAMQGNRLNEVMKKITSWAAIIAVPTAVTGWYGQNLPFPGYGKQWGLAVSVALIAGSIGALYAVFKIKDWL
ncbi:magnesium transporter CorA family protein [Spirillospora sp. NPDC029432]|uniref:magnesium transporter CorA family protein n=1 Tax=Spirillospora sp. NPDC029432 TaxID=3154599 RepID=UPI003451E985